MKRSLYACNKPRNIRPIFAGFLLTFSAYSTIIPSGASALAPQVHGDAAIIGEFSTGMPPLGGGTTYQGWRMPLGLQFEARPTNSIGIFLDLQYGLNHHPYTANQLGNTTESENSPATDGREFAQPFTTVGGRGEKIETAKISQAYMEVSNDKFFLRAGRMPRHWGLGVWRNSEWRPEGGTTSTSDAIAFTFDFQNSVIANVYWEKMSEGKPNARSDDADAFTAEAMVASDPYDTGSSGISRQIGVSIQKYGHRQSNTRIDTLDAFGRFYYGSFLIEGELMYPSGETKSPQYRSLGGSNQCLAPNQTEYLSCNTQKIEMVATLFRLRWEAGGTSGLAATDDARTRLPTYKRSNSHIFGLWFGYASGDSDAFGSPTPDDKVNAAMMHPNIRPAFLMYNSTALQAAGMPGANLTNTLFVRAEYSYEQSRLGQLTPAIIAGWLARPNASTDNSQFGHDRKLGYELSMKYSYLTAEALRFGGEAGLWLPGQAWRSNIAEKTDTVFGLRAFMGTKF